MTHPESNGHVTSKVKDVTPICLVSIISETAGDSDLMIMECLMATWESNGHVTDDVMWPWKVKVVPLICLVETAADRDLVTMEHL